MFQDWQAIIVWLIILAALTYVGRIGLSRMRSFRAGEKQEEGAAASCASGCGSCGDERPAKVARPQNALVQITNIGGTRLPQQQQGKQ